MSKTYDVCVIGSGAAGSILSKVLCNKGASVAIIEQGDFISPGTNLNSIMENSEKAYARNLDGKIKLNGYPWTAIAVGGGTVFYGGVSFRYRDVDFNARDYVAQDALDPIWPIGYHELDSYYNKVEKMLTVCGDTTEDPFYPKYSTGKLHPPHSYSQQGILINEAGKN